MALMSATRKDRGKPLGCIALDGPLFQLKLSGSAVGPRNMKEGVKDSSNNKWPGAEKKRWKESKGSKSLRKPARQGAVSDNSRSSERVARFWASSVDTKSRVARVGFTRKLPLRKKGR